MNANTQLPIRSFILFLICFSLFFSFGFSHQGMVFTQPVLHKGNHLLESWRFRDGDVLKTDRINLYYPASMAKQAVLVSREAEQVLKSFENRYNYTFNKPVPIFLFPDRESLRSHFSWKKGQSATGVYFSGAIYLLNPDVWYEGMPSIEESPEKWAQEFHEKGPLYHEIAHLYLDKSTGGNYPIWYTEAYAQWMEYRELGFEWITPSNQLTRRHLYTYPDLRDHFEQLRNQSLAYRQSFLFLRMIVEQEGEDSLNRLHRQLAKGVAFDQAWKQVFDKETAESYQDWISQIN